MLDHLKKLNNPEVETLEFDNLLCFLLISSVLYVFILPMVHKCLFMKAKHQFFPSLCVQETTDQIPEVKEETTRRLNQLSREITHRVKRLSEVTEKAKEHLTEDITDIHGVAKDLVSHGEDDTIVTDQGEELEELPQVHEHEQEQEEEMSAVNAKLKFKEMVNSVGKEDSWVFDIDEDSSLQSKDTIASAKSPSIFQEIDEVDPLFKLPDKTREIVYHLDASYPDPDSFIKLEPVTVQKPIDKFPFLKEATETPIKPISKREHIWEQDRR